MKREMRSIMRIDTKKNYFILIKFICMISIIVYIVVTGEENIQTVGKELFLFSGLLTASMMFELIKTKRIPLLLLQTALYVTVLVISGEKVLLLFPIILLDGMMFCNASLVFYLLPSMGILLYKGDSFVYALLCVTISIIYVQNHIIIEEYRRYIEEYENKEFILKNTMDNSNLIHRKELEKNSLSFENKMLEEKARLSQALHDKLGHSINGSLYQLEACKVLTVSSPEQSISIVQKVIDSLRGSMDEIRDILRKERPDKKQLALLQLKTLCESCKEKYNIKAEVMIEGKDAEVPEMIWEIILDNTYEAVSNALKYAQCTSIDIKITILNKIVRCSISDNGIGCSTMSEGMGIQGMKQRARNINGVIDIISDNGFVVNMILPFEEQT